MQIYYKNLFKITKITKKYKYLQWLIIIMKMNYKILKKKTNFKKIYYKLSKIKKIDKYKNKNKRKKKLNYWNNKVSSTKILN